MEDTHISLWYINDNITLILWKDSHQSYQSVLELSTLLHITSLFIDDSWQNHHQSIFMGMSIHNHGSARRMTIAGPTEAQRKLMQDPPVAGDGMGDDGSIHYSGELIQVIIHHYTISYTIQTIPILWYLMLFRWIKEPSLHEKPECVASVCIAKRSKYSFEQMQWPHDWIQHLEHTVLRCQSDVLISIASFTERIPHQPDTFGFSKNDECFTAKTQTLLLFVGDQFVGPRGRVELDQEKLLAARTAALQAELKSVSAEWVCHSVCPIEWLFVASTGIWDFQDL